MLAAAAPLNRTPERPDSHTAHRTLLGRRRCCNKILADTGAHFIPEVECRAQVLTEKSHLSFRVIFEEALAILAGESHVHGDGGRACNDGSLARHRAPLTSELHLDSPGRRITYT